MKAVGGEDAEVRCVWLPDRWFQSVRTYNRLMLDDSFYAAFDDYSHMLIHQTDAHVFSDRLQEFCELPIDFIGAPWFSGLHRSKEHDPMLPFAGNGGFSLRRIEAFRSVLKHRERPIEALSEISGRLGMQHRGLSRLTLTALSPFSLLFRNTLSSTGVPSMLQEDMFWSKYASRLEPGFRVASPEMAMQFSWECNPKVIWESMGGSLPFGCHAWKKFDPEFWGPFIKH